MSDPAPQPPGDEQPGVVDRRPSPPVPYLQYTSRPPPPVRDDPVTDLLHALGGAAIYLSMLVAMKAASARFRWDIGGICGAWATLLILSLGVAGWMAGAHGWRGALIGVAVAVLLSLFASPLILRDG